LAEQDARALLGSVVRFGLDERVRDRIVAETNGNPLALLELPRGLDPAQLAGGFGLAGAQAVLARIEQGFRRRIEALPADTRSLMLVAAAEPAGDPVLVWRAAGRLGIAASAAKAAHADGLLETGGLVRFRHPPVWSATLPWPRDEPLCPPPPWLRGAHRGEPAGPHGPRRPHRRRRRRPPGRTAVRSPGSPGRWCGLSSLDATGFR
jgi:hypothetical protein